MSDVYQERYLKHQQRKKESLSSGWGSSKYKKHGKRAFQAVKDVLENRRSQRVFNGEEITHAEELTLHYLFNTAPSSCGRKAIDYLMVDGRDPKALLGGLLVGGVGWIHRADKIMLLFANKLAYKNPAEIPYMPYLDAGVIAQTMYIAAEAMNIGCCYVNPNIREENVEIFNNRFNKDRKIFCGAIALGKYDKKAII